MKFLCVECDQQMAFAERQVPGDGTLAATFKCPKCGRVVAMLTNPMETQLVSSLGVEIGGRTVPAEAFETIGKIGVDQALPLVAAGHLGEREDDDVVVGVEDEEQRRVGARPHDPGRLRAAVEHHAEAALARIAPALLRLLLSARIDPGDPA